jgi:hypothetical protein
MQHFDAIGRPIQLNDTVLVKGYGRCNMDTIAKITKITKKSVHVEIPASYYVRIEDPTVQWGWRYERRTDEVKLMKRSSSDFIVINEQLKYNRDTWPELFI